MKSRCSLIMLNLHKYDAYDGIDDEIIMMLITAITFIANINFTLQSAKC